MKLRDALLGARQKAERSLWKARTVGRVAVQTGMPASLRWPGARVLLRELPRGKASPSLLFRFHAENDPHRIAVLHPRSLLPPHGDPRAPVVEDRAYSFFELNDLMDRIGLALDRRGAGAGSSVLVVLKNRPEFIAIQPAIGRIGGAAVSASWRSTPREFEYLARHSGARALFFDADVASVVREAAPLMPGIPRERMIAVGGEVPGFTTFEELISERGAAPDRSDEAAVVMYTSGTTGKPKGAVRKFSRDTIPSALAFIGETPMRVGDVHLAVCPFYHATAFGFISLSYLLGGSVVVLPEFRPELFLEAVQRYRVTTTALVPTMIHRLVELGADRIRSYDTSSLRAIFSGGAPLQAALAIGAMNVLGDKLYNFYGSTETGLVTVAGPDDLRASPGTIGRAIPGAEIRLVDEQGREVEGGGVGELYARSSQLVDGYHNDPDATRQSMLDGFFSVGDLARRDRRGCYHIEGRKRDMIISGGVNVYPAEVEAALHDHPAVADAAVVGVPDQEWGERVRAFVVLRPGAAATDDDLRAHCRARLAGPKVPRDYVLLDELPRNPTGKILKRELAQWKKEGESE
ncbi:MAG: AMP-binding protein [Polyangiaceae bacterium]|nr:AMP-binding protein [Polyangiaceae bacterium]